MPSKKERGNQISRDGKNKKKKEKIMSEWMEMH
jgi:hypothetical protein